MPKDERNLAHKLSDEKLQEIGQLVLMEFEMDLRSRADWETRRASWFRLFALVRSPKSFPWENCSNVAVPTVSVACLQFHARAFEALFGQRELVRAKWTDATAKDSALRVGRYMNYQLTQQMDEWEADMDAMLLQLPINGSCFKKTYYDPILKRPVSRYISVDDFVAPYGARSLEDCIRKSHILRPWKHDVERLMASGHYLDIGQIDTPIADQTQITDAKDMASGQTIATEDQSTAKLIEQHRWLTLNDVPEPYIVTIDAVSGKVLRLESLSYEADGEIKELSFFTHYTFIPNPEGLYGFGFGHFLEGLAAAIDSLTNQLIDAGTLNNLVGGFVAKRSGMKTGDLKFKMGEYKQVDISTDDIRKAVFQFDFKAPSQVLFNLLSLLQDYASRLSTVSDTIIGQMPPADTAATTVLAVLEQGLKVFSTIQKRIHRSLRQELRKIFVLNSIHLNEAEYIEVQDSESGEFATITVGADDFKSTIDIIPTADPNIVSKAERLIKAQQAWQFAQGNPLISNDPQALYEISREYLRALDFDAVDKVLKPPQPPQPVDVPPQEENAGFIQEKDSGVLPQQDHNAHMFEHSVFRDSGWGQKMSPQARNLLDAHIRATQAALYKSEVEGGSQSRGMEGMGLTPDNPMLSATLGGQAPVA